MPPAADIIRQAARLNREDARRQGSTVRIEGPCEVIVAGDIHGHRQNLAKVLDYADLPSHPDRYLVLQEIIHAPAEAAGGHDRSVELLVRVARLKCSSSRQLLFVLGNHDVAQVTGSEILKNGRGICKAFSEGARHAFGELDAPEILAAVEDFLLSLPLAVACDNGVLIVHSVPSPDRMAAVGTAILARDFTRDDLKRNGPAYDWTWGRNPSSPQLESLAAELGVNFFILGHQHVGAGIEVISPRAVAIASDHPHGQILPFRTDQPVTADTALAMARPIVALGSSR